MCAFSVFGNPIIHSKSPEVYSIFAKQYGMSQLYTRVLAFWMNFDYVLKNFFCLGGTGANITMPFKERAFYLCDKVTSRASIAGSVNTIKRVNNGVLLGDNTDGVGLLTDLNRLQWVMSNNSNKAIKVLLLGAGGASRGVIFPLLNSGCQVDVMNRTSSRARKLVDRYKHLGKISFVNLEDVSRASDVSCSAAVYDIIINATSGIWVHDQSAMLPVTIITPNVACYDMSYDFQSNRRMTPFISWCRKNGALRYSDGLGMLVGQAAHSFLFWHDVFPCIDSVFSQLGIV